MYSDSPDYVNHVNETIKYVSENIPIPEAHINYLKKLSYEFEPRVCYDIGSGVLQWCKQAEKIWPSTEVILFDAYKPAELVYGGHRYNIDVLSDVDGREVKYYQNDLLFAGSSYYREAPNQFGDVFPEDRYLVKKTRSLDSVVKERGFPLPDLVKIDVQGAELDVINGGKEVLKHARYLIVELQDVQYNLGAPMASESVPYIESLGWRCIARKFSDNGPDGDYCFVRASE